MGPTLAADPRFPQKSEPLPGAQQGVSWVCPPAHTSFPLFGPLFLRRRGGDSPQRRPPWGLLLPRGGTNFLVPRLSAFSPIAFPGRGVGPSLYRRLFISTSRPSRCFSLPPRSDHSCAASTSR